MKDNRMSKGRIQSIRTQMINERDQHLPTWRLLSKYIVPRRLKEDGSPRIDGRRKDEHIIRNTAGLSLRTYVSGMMNGATPRTRPWFDMVTSDHKLTGDDSVKRYLEDVEKTIQSYLQLGNFYRVLPLAYKDVGVFSNAAFAMLPHPKYGFYFYPYTIGTYAFSTDAEGNSNMFTRDSILTVRQCVETFGNLKETGQIDWSNFNPAIKSAWDSARYLDDVNISQVIIPNASFNTETAANSLDPLDKKFQAYTYTTGVGGQSTGPLTPDQNSTGFREQQAGNEDYLKVSGYNYFPVITPRWEIEPEGSYGIDGPGHMALSDILTLQDQEIMRMEGAQKLVRPPMVGHASMRRHQSSILAGGITYVDDRAANLKFQPAFTVGPALAELVQNEREVEEMIRSAFYYDIFMMMSGQEVKSHVTKAEINERSAERMTMLSPVLGQFEFDITSKVINNAQLILEGQGRMPEKPEQMRNKSIRPEYTSILAQASKASIINTQERYANFLGSLAQATGNPAIVKLLKEEQYARSYADNIGLDPNLLRTEEEYSDIVEQQNQQAEENRAMERAQVQVDSINKLGNTPAQEGSMLDTLV